MAMRDLFPGYYKPKEEDFNQIWEQAVFIFDANVLLNIYRYSPKTRERFFDILEKFKEKIWIPYQIAYEYQMNRQTVIKQQLQAYADIKKIFSDNLNNLNKGLNNYKKHVFINEDIKKQLLEILEEAKKTTDTILDQTKSQHDLVDVDDLHDKLNEVLGDNIGERYPDDKLQVLYQEAEQRYKDKIPPGYKENKAAPEKYGDFVIWQQLIDYANSEKKSLIYITDDDKEDWWSISQGERKGVRPELVQEIHSKAGVFFYMYSSDKFMEFAEKFLNLPHQQEIIEEARDIRIQNEEDQLTEKKKAVKRARELAEQAAALTRIDPEFLKKIQATAAINPEVFKQLQTDYAGILKATAINPEVFKQLQTDYAGILKAAAINPEVFKQLQINLQGYSDIIKTISLNNYEEDIDSTLDIEPTSD